MRRSLYMLAFVFFMMGSPLLVFYASGYRYDIGKRQFVRVGALYIKSYPAGSSILMDSHDIRKKTPNRILNVFPGIHEVSVTRDAFAPWTKKLSVESGQTTYARDIVLFRSNPPKQVLSIGGSDPIVSDDGSLYLFLDAAKKIHLTNTDTHNDFSLETSVAPQKIFAMTADNSAALFSVSRQLYSVDLNTEKIKKIKLSAAEFPEKARWDRTNNSLIWLLSKGTLASLNIDSDEYKVMLSDVSDFIFGGDTLATIELTGSKIYARAYRLGVAEPYWQHELALQGQPSIIDLSGSYMTIRTANIVARVRVGSDDPPAIYTASAVDVHDAKLLLAGDFELYFYGPDNVKPELIDRSSEKIQKILWHPSGSYFLRAIGSRVELVELDSRDVRNVVNIPDVPTDAHFIFDKKGSNLFVLTPDENKVLELQ